MARCTMAKFFKILAIMDLPVMAKKNLWGGGHTFENVGYITEKWVWGGEFIIAGRGE